MTNESYPKIVDQLSSLIDRYDAFVIDQWGVLHDGGAVYPGVIEALRLIKEAGKPALILTNSSKTDAVNVQRLDQRFGIHGELYSLLISSAQILKDRLAARREEPYCSLGARVYVVADGQDACLLDGLDYERCTDITSADFVVLLSVAPDHTVEDHLAWISVAAKRGLPLFCPSADVLSVNIQGVVNGMGPVIQEFSLLGGNVINLGKPSSDVYCTCKARLGTPEGAKILAIGDQIESDIFGANAQGWDAALVMTGASQKRFANQKSLEDVVQHLVSSQPISHWPRWISPSFQ
jgi:HAD superfamily hydrolase (TIGR01459 family)